VTSSGQAAAAAVPRLLVTDSMLTDAKRRVRPTVGAEVSKSAPARGRGDDAVQTPVDEMLTLGAGRRGKPRPVTMSPSTGKTG